MSAHAAVSIAGLTDVGQIRQVNEDAVLIDEDARLFAIADGMGGHGSGDVASQLALDTLQSCITSDSVSKALAHKDISDTQAQSLVYQCIVDVNQRIYRENAKNGHIDGTGMGTTLVGFCTFGCAQRAISFNVGDSRMYRDWEEAGKIGPAPPRNIILRAVGLFADVDIDMDVLELNHDATYLLCSDGLTGMVSDENIATILSLPNDAHTHNKALIDRANENGGIDNISVVTLTPSDMG